MIYIFLALGLYTAALIFGAAAARNVNSNFASAVTTIISAITTTAVALPLFSRKTVTDNKFGVIMAVLSGVTVALFTLAINKGFTLNKVGIVSPIVLGGAIFLSTILSYFVFKEKVSLIQFIGLVFLAIGLGAIIYARATGK
jgi:uncharacterized membrane protein